MRVTTDWDWLTAVDPVAVERERFVVDLRKLKRTEGLQRGYLAVEPSVADRRRTREKEQLTVVTKNRGVLHSRIRTLESELAREKREREKEAAWKIRVEEIKGRGYPGLSSLKERKV